MSSDSSPAAPARQDLASLTVTATLRTYQRQWWSILRERAAAGEPIIVAGSNTPHEIFEALDLPFVTDVWYSGLVAAKKMSGRYSDVLAEHGYHRGLDRYEALPLGVALDFDDDAPWGGIPTPSLVVSAPDKRSAELFAEFHGARYIGFERPIQPRPFTAWWELGRHAWQDLEGGDRIDAMTAQFEYLIAVCEQIAGTKLDRDRLAQILADVNEQEECFNSVRTAIQTAPKLPVRLGEAMSQVMGIQWHRGTPWAVAQATAFRDEVWQRVADHHWVCPTERYRLMYLGQGLWQQLNFFAEFEQSHGVVFARSNYLSIACDAYPRYGTGDPVRTLAARYSTFNDYLHYPPWAGSWAVWEARTHRLHGAVQLDNGHGLKYIARALETEGLPVLQFPTDAVDSNAWDEMALRALVENFIETRLDRQELQ
jgi:hypothetical protein